jgi:hypothetical protein
VSPVRYKLGFYIPEDGILHSHRRGHLKSLKWSYVRKSPWVRDVDDPTLSRWWQRLRERRAMCSSARNCYAARRPRVRIFCKTGLNRRKLTHPGADEETFTLRAFRGRFLGIIWNCEVKQTRGRPGRQFRNRLAAGSLDVSSVERVSTEGGNCCRAARVHASSPGQSGQTRERNS